MNFMVVFAVNTNPYLAEQKKIISAAATNTGLAPTFPEYDFDDPKFDLPHTLSLLKSSAFVLADLSYERPSCYYELGLAEALHKPIFAIATVDTAIHQAACREKVLFYEGLDQYELLVTKIFVMHQANSKTN